MAAKNEREKRKEGERSLNCLQQVAGIWEAGSNCSALVVAITKKMGGKRWPFLFLTWPGQQMKPICSNEVQPIKSS